MNTPHDIINRARKADNLLDLQKVEYDLSVLRRQFQMACQFVQRRKEDLWKEAGLESSPPSVLH